MQEQLMGRLRAARESCRSLPIDQRREHLRRLLQDELKDVPVEKVEDLLRSVRARLVEEGDAESRPAAGPDPQLDQLRSQVQTLSSDRARLQQEIENLRTRSVEPGQQHNLDRVREALLAITQDRALDVQSLGLGRSDERRLLMMQILLRFVLNYELAANMLLTEIGVGSMQNMDTVQQKSFQGEVRKRFQACVEGEEGSIRALEAAVEQNGRFLVELNRAYGACIHGGSRSLLDELDPQPILEKHKRLMGFNHEAAFSELAQAHADLTNLTRHELWERHFAAELRKSLSGLTEPTG